MLEQEKLIESQQEQLVEQAPKVDFYDAVVDSKTAISMGDVAKVLNIKGYGRTNLFRLLRDRKIFMKGNRPYQQYINSGHFRVVEREYTRHGEVGVNVITTVHQKGVDLIRKIILSDGMQFINTLRK